MAFVVILHLAPDHESTLDSILQRVNAMPVRQVNTTMQVEPDHVYVIPPGHDLAMGERDLAGVDDLPAPAQEAVLPGFLDGPGVVDCQVQIEEFRWG